MTNHVNERARPPGRTAATIGFLILLISSCGWCGYGLYQEYRVVTQGRAHAAHVRELEQHALEREQQNEARHRAECASEAAAQTQLAAELHRVRTALAVRERGLSLAAWGGGPAAAVSDP